MVRTLINLINILLQSRANENDMKVPKQQTLKAGLVSAGIGGLATAIAIVRAGTDVTVLKAAPELGEVWPPVISFCNSKMVINNEADWSWHPDDPKCGSPAASVGPGSSYRR